MRKCLSSLRKYALVSLCVICIGTVELLLLRDNVSILFFNQWNDWGTPPSGAAYAVEYGFAESKDGKIYQHYAVVDPKEGWKNVWVETAEINEYYSYDRDISTCHIPDIVNVKSIVLRCRKLENYSKTYAMAVTNDGRVFDYIGPSLQDFVSHANLIFLILAVNINFGLLVIIFGYLVERLSEREQKKQQKSRYYSLD